MLVALTNKCEFILIFDWEFGETGHDWQWGGRIKTVTIFIHLKTTISSFTVNFLIW